MSAKFNWQKVSGYVAFQAEMPGNVTLCVTPDRQRYGKALRGSGWHAQASHWNEATRTMSSFGRDEYGVLFKTADDAKRAAEAIYKDAIS